MELGYNKNQDVVLFVILQFFGKERYLEKNAFSDIVSIGLRHMNPLWVI